MSQRTCCVPFFRILPSSNARRREFMADGRLELAYCKSRFRCISSSVNRTLMPSIPHSFKSFCTACGPPIRPNRRSQVLLSLSWTVTLSSSFREKSPPCGKRSRRGLQVSFTSCSGRMRMICSRFMTPWSTRFKTDKASTNLTTLCMG